MMTPQNIAVRLSPWTHHHHDCGRVRSGADCTCGLQEQLLDLQRALPAVRPEPPAAEPLTFTAFSAANRKRCEDPQGFNHELHSWSTSDWFVAVIGELGEAANIVKKLNRYRDGIRGNKESEAALRAKLRGELADAFIYLDLIFQACGFVTADAVADTFDAKSVEVGYPHQLRAAVPAQEGVTDRKSAADGDVPVRGRDAAPDRGRLQGQVVGEAVARARESRNRLGTRTTSKN